jgi:hypothetical protein
MTTIADIVSAERTTEPGRVMERYIGFSFASSSNATVYRIIAVGLVPLRELRHEGRYLTVLFRRRYNLGLQHLDFPVFFCSVGGAMTPRIFDVGGGEHVCRGAAMIPPELCDLSTGKLIAV